MPTNIILQNLIFNLKNATSKKGERSCGMSNRKIIEDSTGGDIPRSRGRPI